jgi:hypothetical protein
MEYEKFEYFSVSWMLKNKYTASDPRFAENEIPYIFKSM